MMFSSVKNDKKPGRIFQKSSGKTAEKQEAELPQAVILAGGRGVRLRPLTERLPKPLLPVGGKPVILRILENLEHAGVKKALILTGYKGEMIEEALGLRAGRIEISYICEKESAGSAGCVKKAAEKGALEKEFFVVCGDAYGERDYKGFYESFIKNGADASVLLCRVKDPGEYGIVQTDRQGNVTGFLEKPFWSQVFSDRANSGIYLLKRETLAIVPEGVSYDFGGDFFPALLKSGGKVSSFEDSGVWRDVGDFSSYLSCCLAENGGGSVFFPGASAGEGSVVRDSVVFGGVQIGKDCQIEGAIIDEDCRIGDRSVVPSGCVLGARCKLPPDSILPAGSVLPLDSAVGDGVGLFAEQPDLKRLFSETTLRFAREVPEGFCFRLGRAAGESFGHGAHIGVFHDSNRSSAAAASELLEGICVSSPGADCGEAFYAMAGSVTRESGMKFSFLVSKDLMGRTSIDLFDENGLPPGSAVLRTLRDKTSRASERDRDGSGRSFGSFVPERREKECADLYAGLLDRSCFADLSGMLVGVGFGTPPLAQLSRILLGKRAIVCGEKGSEGFIVSLSPDGSRAQIKDGSGVLDHWHLAAILMKREIETGGRIAALPYRAPSVLFSIAGSMGQFPVGFALTPTGRGLDEARAAGAKLTFLFDGCASALGGLALLAEKKTTCAGLSALLPPFCVLESTVDCEEKEKLRWLTEKGFSPAGEGVDKRTGGRRVYLLARERRGFQLSVEAGEIADARELMKAAREELKRAEKQEEKNRLSERKNGFE